MALRYGPNGVAISDARYQDATVVPRGVPYRPYPPVHLSASPDGGGDWSLSWVRRTRYGGDAWDQPTVPLNEDFERYEVDILDGDTVVRTVVVDGTPNYVYTEAQQIEDFGAAVTSLQWVVYQMSAVFGRGAPAHG